MAKSKTIDIKVEWHKATETPKKNAPIYLLFKVGKRKYPLCRLMTFHHSNVVPAECEISAKPKPRSHSYLSCGRMQARSSRLLLMILWQMQNLQRGRGTKKIS